MAGNKVYRQKGSLREECMKNIATLKDLRVLECDWREIFRWIMSVSGDLPYFNNENEESGKLSSLWENHVLTVLVDILQKEVCGYVDSFVESHGSSAQQGYTDRLQGKIGEWAARLNIFIRQSHSTLPGSPSIEVAELLLDKLENALPARQGVNRPSVATIAANDASRPYFQMLGTINDIQQHAEEYMARIESGSDMDATLALLLTFVRNYCDIASLFNRRFENWPAFYRKNILGNDLKGAVQDSTFFVIEPNREKIDTTFSLSVGTSFIAGKKADGTPLTYATTSKEYIVPAHIRTIYSLTCDNGRLYAVPTETNGQDNACPLFSIQNPAVAILEYGWLLTSRSFILSEGNRSVTVCFNLGSTPDLSLLSGDADSFCIQISGSKGWISKEYTLSYIQENSFLQFSFTLDENEEAPIACLEELHGISTEYPALRILFANKQRIKALSGLHIYSIRIHTKVEGIRNFTLMSESGLSAPSQPFYPFGTLGERNSRIIFGHEEAALKEVTSVTLKGSWSKLPAGGFSPIYQNYDTENAIGDDSFSVRCEWQDSSGWHEFSDSPRALFNKEADNSLSERAVFTFDNSVNPAINKLMPYQCDRKGFYRMILVAPDIGFGMIAYYKLFSEVMIYNSREKKQNYKPLPEMPQIPMLTDTTFGYQSEEMLCPENGELYRFTDFIGYEACRNINRQPPVFLPDVDAPSLIIGLDNMGDTCRLRLYFDLQYFAEGGMPMVEQPKHTLYISHYANNGLWTALQQDEILCEETDGLTRSGFIEIKVQERTNADYVWLRFSFDEGKKPEGVALNGIYINYIRVQAIDGDGTPLPAGTIATPALPDNRILAIAQMQSGTGGKPAETETDADIRQRIRIATRNRAVCGKDYELLILNKFPEVEKVCCIPACSNDSVSRIVVFPKTETKKYPFLPGWKLTEMEKYIRQYASPFARVMVINPIYEPIDVHFKAMLKKETLDQGQVIRRTERRIRTFFMAWYIDGTLPDLGTKYSHKALLSRIENDECIERSEYLKITKRSGVWNTRDDDEIIYEATEEYGILYVRDIVVELEEYRSCIESAQIGTTFTIG